MESVDKCFNHAFVGGLSVSGSKLTYFFPFTLRALLLRLVSGDCVDEDSPLNSSTRFLLVEFDARVTFDFRVSFPL